MTPDLATVAAMTRRLLPLTLLLAACSSTSTVSTTTAPPPPTTGATVADTAPDPYDVYLATPGADTAISREDAQTRALLGCKLSFAPGTVDAALQQAYAPLIEDWRKQGMCG